VQGVQCTRAQRCGEPKICPTLFFKSFFGEEGALLEYLHAGPLQPCYATAQSNDTICPSVCLSVSLSHLRGDGMVGVITSPLQVHSIGGSTVCPMPTSSAISRGEGGHFTLRCDTLFMTLESDACCVVGAGTPFNIKVTSRTDASKVRVSGPGLQPGLLATFQSDLLVQTSGAGPGRLTVRVRGPKGLPDVYCLPGYLAELACIL